MHTHLAQPIPRCSFPIPLLHGHARLHSFENKKISTKIKHYLIEGAAAAGEHRLPRCNCFTATLLPQLTIPRRRIPASASRPRLIARREVCPCRS